MAYLPGQKKGAKTAAPEVIAIPGSSFLQAASYDASSFSLTIEFKNGRQDVHRFVYPMVWAQFKEHSSHGSFYARQIKGKYPTVNFRKTLKVSDITKAKKEYGNDATKRK